MGSNGQWSVLYCIIFNVIIHNVGSDWLNCDNIKECQCKWSSGKKTALCVEAGLTKIPHLATDIQVLDLHGNPLGVLEQDAFASIELLNLQRLNLSLTYLRAIHPHAFRELRILIELDISQNQLLHLSPDTFTGNDRLRLLVLNDNPLSYLVAEQFPPLQHLKRLELSRCKLRTVHPFAFVNLRALEMVQLHQNLLTTLHKDTFNLPVLKTLTLSENPWYCDCRLKEFHEWYLLSNVGNEEIICKGPNKLSRMTWRTVQGKDMVCLPTVLTHPTSIRTEAGDDIHFSCFANGHPVPKVTWLLNERKLENYTESESFVFVHKKIINYFDEFQEDYINKSAQWINVTITNVTTDFSGEWKCVAKSSAGVSSARVTLVLPKARTATARVAPNYSTLFMVAGSMLALSMAGFVGTCICWKTRRQRVPPSRSFTDQEKKLLDTSLAVSYDRSSGDLGSSYGFEMLDRSMSIESDEIQRLEPVSITIEGAHGSFPPPPAEFALPVPYGSIFISVQVAGHNEKYPDLLNSGATLPRRSKTCFLKPAYDNMGPRITAAGSSTWSLPGANVNSSNGDKNTPLQMQLSNFSTEFTAL